jgi:uncharacterized protein
MATNNTGGRGFAGMDEEKQREIASRGGKAAHEKGTAHEFTSEEAREAGRRGGKASHGGRDQDDSEDGRSRSQSDSGKEGSERNDSGRSSKSSDE